MPVQWVPMTTTPRPHRIGVISDTHGLLRDEAVDALRGVERILHAGDVQDPAILDRLGRIAPVTAVRGNVDHGPVLGALPKTATVEVGDARLVMVHILHDLDVDPAKKGYDAVIYGHSHEPTVDTRDGVLYLNPGSAGPRRFTLPVCLYVLTVRGRELEAERIDLA